MEHTVTFFCQLPEYILCFIVAHLTKKNGVMAIDIVGISIIVCGVP